jgi:hypothetical protein
VAVRGQWSLCLDVHQHCWVLPELSGAGAAGSCYYQQRPEVVVLDTGRMEYERGYSVKMCLVGEEVAEVGEVVDTADHTLADSCWLSSGPLVRERLEAEAAGHIDNHHQACCTVDNSQ